MSYRDVIPSAVAIIIITIIVYYPSLKGDFLWDDDLFLTENRLIKDDNGLSLFWFTTEAPDYFPLTSTTLWIEWRLWGKNPLGYRITNLILHITNSLLLWLLLHKLKIPLPWLAGLLFAIHPVNVESTAWITERKNLVSMIFYLLSLISFTKFEESEKRYLYILSLFTFLLALLGKTSVVMLPLVLLFFSWWKKGNAPLKEIRLYIPFFLLSLILGLVTVWFQYNRAIGDDIVRTDNLLSRLSIAGIALWFYLYKALLPFHLSFVYREWSIDEREILSYIPGILFVLSMYILWLKRKTWGRPFFFAVGLFSINLFPVLGFFNIYFMRYSPVADHWQYFSIAAIIALATGGGSTLFRRIPSLYRYAVILPVAVAILLSVLTWNRTKAFRDVESLWKDTLHKNPNAWMAYNNLGLHHARQGKTEEAISLYVKSLEIKPDHWEAYNNIGIAMMKKGNLKEAEQHLRKALIHKPNSRDVLNNLGVTLLKQERLEEAAQYFRRILSDNPGYIEAMINLGNTLLKSGSIDEAIDSYTKAMNIDPRNPELNNNLGKAFEIKGKPEDAVKLYKNALKGRPDYTETHKNLGIIFAKTKNLDKALYHLQKAAALNRNDMDVRYNIALALELKGDISRAVREYENLLKITPNRPELMDKLAWIFATSKDSSFRDGKKALELSKRACELTGYKHPLMMETLAASYAEAGRLKEALETALKALHIAKERGMHKLVSEIEEKVRQYERLTISD